MQVGKEVVEGFQGFVQLGRVAALGREAVEHQAEGDFLVGRRGESLGDAVPVEGVAIVGVEVEPAALRGVSEGWGLWMGWDGMGWGLGERSGIGCREFSFLKRGRGRIE